jgi:hypothetical protein
MIYIYDLYVHSVERKPPCNTMERVASTAKCPACDAPITAIMVNGKIVGYKCVHTSLHHVRSVWNGLPMQNLAKIGQEKKPEE